MPLNNKQSSSGKNDNDVGLHRDAEAAFTRKVPLNKKQGSSSKNNIDDDAAFTWSASGNKKQGSSGKNDIDDDAGENREVDAASAKNVLLNKKQGSSGKNDDGVGLNTGVGAASVLHHAMGSMVLQEAATSTQMKGECCWMDVLEGGTQCMSRNQGSWVRLPISSATSPRIRSTTRKSWRFGISLRKSS